MKSIVETLKSPNTRLVALSAAAGLLIAACGNPTEAAPKPNDSSSVSADYHYGPTIDLTKDHKEVQVHDGDTLSSIASSVAEAAVPSGSVDPAHLTDLLTNTRAEQLHMTPEQAIETLKPGDRVELPQESAMGMEVYVGDPTPR